MCSVQPGLCGVSPGECAGAGCLPDGPDGNRPRDTPISAREARIRPLPRGTEHHGEDALLRHGSVVIVTRA